VAGEKKKKKQQQLMRPLKTWRPYEWVSFREAWQRVTATVAGSLPLTQRVLHRDFLRRRLIMAVRYLAADGAERRFTVDVAYWPQLKINYAWLITGWETEHEPRKGEEWAYFVGRRELDRFYPAATTIAQQADIKPTKRTEKSQRRKGGGRRRKYNWAALQRLAKDIIQSEGLPATQASLRDKVALAAPTAKPRPISVPQDTQFKEIIDPIHRQHRRKSETGQK
jgi:hypothetical protein